MKNAFQRKVWWPLKVLQYDENGKEIDATPVVLVTVMDKAAMKALEDLGMQSLLASRDLMRMATMPGADADATAAKRAALEKQIADNEQSALVTLGDAIHGWRNLVDSVSNEAIEYSPEIKADLLRFNDMQQAFTNALRDASNGARAKN